MLKRLLMSKYSSRTRRRGDAETRRKEKSRHVSCSFPRRVSASPRPRVFLLAVGLLFFAGCRQDMQDQPRYEAYEASGFFKNGMASRPLVDGTVPRGFLRADKQLFTGQSNTAQGNANTSTTRGQNNNANSSNSNTQSSSNNANMPMSIVSTQQGRN